MELRVWVDDGDLEAMEAENGQTEQEVLDEISEAIAEFCGQKYGIIVNTETAE